MKKLIILLLLGGLLTSCGSSKAVMQSKKKLKGDWTLNTITYDASGTYDITLLNDESKVCFEGSLWHFVPNNNTGTYSINNSNCNAGPRYFKFSIAEVNSEQGLYDLMLKPTDNKYKSDTNKGFRLHLSKLTDSDLQLQQTLNVEGKPFTINMNFSKKETTK